MAVPTYNDARRGCYRGPVKVVRCPRVGGARRRSDGRRKVKRAADVGRAGRPRWSRPSRGTSSRVIASSGARSAASAECDEVDLRERVKDVSRSPQRCRYRCRARTRVTASRVAASLGSPPRRGPVNLRRSPRVRDHLPDAPRIFEQALQGRDPRSDEARCRVGARRARARRESAGRRRRSNSTFSIDSRPASAAMVEDVVEHREQHLGARACALDELAALGVVAFERQLRSFRRCRFGAACRISWLMVARKSLFAHDDRLGCPPPRSRVSSTGAAR